MLLGEIISNYRKEHKLSQRQFAERCGDITNGYISMLENNKNPSTNKPIIPSLDKLKSIANGMGMNLQDLLDIADDMLVDISDNEVSLNRVPVLGRIPAGIPIDAIEDVEDWEELPASMLKGDKKFFGLIVRGDSMLPEYRNGDVLIIQQQDNCDNGDDCAVMVNNGEATFKRVRKTEKGITLQPLNPAYDPLFFTNEEIEELPVRILGVVVEVRRKIRR